MNVIALNLDMYDALVEAGVPPERARKVERQQDALQAQLHEQQAQLMTKHDGDLLRAELKTEIQEAVQKLEKAILTSKTDMLKLMNDQTWKLVGFVVVFNTLLVGAIKLFP